MLSVDAEAGEVPQPQAAPPAAAAGSGETVVLKAHYGSAAAAEEVVRRNSPLVGLAKSKSAATLSVASKPGEDAAAGGEAEGEAYYGGGSTGTGSRGPSVFDNVERNMQPRWKRRVVGVMDGVPYTLLSMLITFIVRVLPPILLTLLQDLPRLLRAPLRRASGWEEAAGRRCRPGRVVAGLPLVRCWGLDAPPPPAAAAANTRRCCTRTTSGSR